MIRRLRDQMRLSSRFRYLGWRLVGYLWSTRPLGVTLKSGARILLRPAPSSDVPVAMEVFAVGSYNFPTPIGPPSPKRIVDLGANAGFSVVHFAKEYPDSQIEAYEPHPKQREQLLTHIRLNHLENRVIVRPVAVSNRSVGQLHLTDNDAMAQLVPIADRNTISVPVVDWFGEVGTQPIDVLKIDIEGSEREIVLDPRFRKLAVRSVMLEWHALHDWLTAESDVKQVLTGMGMRIVDGPRGSYRGVDCGIVWGIRSSQFPI